MLYLTNIAPLDEQGARALWGRCYEDPGAPPYWPWARLLGAYPAQAVDARTKQVAEAGGLPIGCRCDYTNHTLVTTGRSHCAPSRCEH